MINLNIQNSISQPYMILRRFFMLFQGQDAPNHQFDIPTTKDREI